MLVPEMTTPTTMADEPRPGRADRSRPTETYVGALLVGCSILGGIAMAIHPQTNAVDRWGFEWIANSPHSTVLSKITDLGSAAVLAIGALLAALVCIRRDRRTALACVIGPLLCAIAVEYVFKPLVGRRFEGVLSYPSGSVADLAAVATAWVLAVPARVRPFFVLLGAIAVGAMFTAVIGLRWHLPTDALAGVLLGAGVVLLVDGLLHLRPASTSDEDHRSQRSSDHESRFATRM
jgi:membrane-associated phospholipid phosphatase